MHHQILAGIPNPQRFAFGVELGEGEVLFILQHTGRVFHTVVGDGNDITAQAVEDGEGGRVAVLLRPARRHAFSGVLEFAGQWIRGHAAGQDQAIALGGYRLLTPYRSGQSADMPGRELDPAEAAVGHFGAHRAAGGIVVDDRRDAFFARGSLEAMADVGLAEVGLVLFDRFALVVEDGLAAGDPAQRVCPGFSGSAWTFFTTTLPMPSEYSKLACSGLFSPGAKLADVLLAQQCRRRRQGVRPSESRSCRPEVSSISPK